MFNLIMYVLGFIAAIALIGLAVDRWFGLTVTIIVIVLLIIVVGVGLWLLTRDLDIG
jgi:hypothetical protein